MSRRLDEPEANARRGLWWAFFLSASIHAVVSGLAVHEGFFVPGGQIARRPAMPGVPLLIVRIDGVSRPVLAAVPEAVPANTAASMPGLVLPPAPPEDEERAPPVRGISSAIYLPAESLAEPPRPLAVDPIEVPTEPGVTAGRIVIEVAVDENGLPAQIRTIESNVPGPFLFKVYRAFTKARYEPGRLVGKPVKSSLRIEITYDMAATDGVITINKPPGLR